MNFVYFGYTTRFLVYKFINGYDHVEPKDIHHISLVPPTMTTLDLYDICNVFVPF